MATFCGQRSKCLCLQLLSERQSKFSQYLDYCTGDLVLFIVHNFPMQHKIDFIREIITLKIT